MNKRSRLFDELVVKSWWAILFVLICLFTYDRAISKRKEEQRHLELRFEKIELSSKAAIEKRIDLKEQIASQNDPQWIELTLMRKLGLVPEGQKKVSFN
ncbi:MAG: hypothetical protein S4CHLAM45_14050 [Chlamydiales bacterium]|nr:hypothetical protein [Chlamydiales bacterium]MCH9620510.1 hypothetical protein [Chlamydiales bacterium]MCH9623495.1 hypothetical protein [Chlamydiales bacterium]